MLWKLVVLILFVGIDFCWFDKIYILEDIKKFVNNGFKDDLICLLVFVYCNLIGNLYF